MKRGLDSSTAGRGGPLPRFFTACFGAFLGLALLKFGNPPIMEKLVTAPSNVYEFILGSPWPIAWGYAMLGLVGVGGLSIVNRKAGAPSWLVALPLLWLLWECVAALWTVNPGLTKPTVGHFFACAACFYLGYFSLSGVRRLTWFWLGLVCALCIVIVVGWEQRFGGLERTRQYFFLYLYPRLKEVSPEYLKKISSTRIFSTLFYPNSLAGALLLLLPVSLEFVWQARERFAADARLFLVSAVGVGGLGCLYWSGSKGGWLLMLLLGLIWLLSLPLRRELKRAVIAAVLVVGLSVFVWKYAGFFERGATSVGARFDYWRAAVQTTLAHPLSGTGPGTFSIAYQKFKRPESEMTRLVHNDYLEQASDSGLPGFLIYAAFVAGVLTVARPDPRQRVFALPAWLSNPERPSQIQSGPGSASKVASTDPREPAIFYAIWLGVLGWAAQGLFEFGLYIPSLAWPAFAFLGLLLGRRFSAVRS